MQAGSDPSMHVIGVHQLGRAFRELVRTAYELVSPTGVGVGIGLLQARDEGAGEVCALWFRELKGDFQELG